MSKSKDINDANGVDALIKQMPSTLAEMVQRIRELILATDTSVGEQVKWNSPSFFYLGEMKAFDAKEYKRDIVVIHTQKGYPLLIFPTGAGIKDESGLLEGDYKDGRRMISFKTIQEVEAKGKDLQGIVQNWLNLIEPVEEKED